MRTILVSFISGASASIMIFATRPIINFIGKVDEISIYDPITLLGCFMAGLISIGASCQNVALESALIIGPIGTILFMLSKKILLKMEIDDALNQFSIHGVCGFWGLMAAGIFDQKKGTLRSG